MTRRPQPVSGLLTWLQQFRIYLSYLIEQNLIIAVRAIPLHPLDRVRWIRNDCGAQKWTAPWERSAPRRLCCGRLWPESFYALKVGDQRVKTINVRRLCGGPSVNNAPVVIYAKSGQVARPFVIKLSFGVRFAIRDGRVILLPTVSSSLNMCMCVFFQLVRVPDVISAYGMLYCEPGNHGLPKRQKRSMSFNDVF